MRAVIQRVRSAKVTIREKEIAKIEEGIMLLLGVGKSDTLEDIRKLAEKVVGLRIFEDKRGKINLSLKDIEGEILIVPQFTLYANTKKGRRPSFEEASKPQLAQSLFDEFILELERIGFTPKRGKFGEHMVVNIENDGPLTIILDTGLDKTL